MICQICGQEFKRITATHLAKHWTNTIVYKIIYPKVALYDEETKSDLLKK